MEMSSRTILHIDFDSFFASAEQQYNPLLRKRPIGVTATNGRTCVIASSREAKRKGVKTGSRTQDAVRLCSDIIFVPADFVKYWEISKKFITICQDFSPLVEVFSIDELFMDVTESVHLFGNVDNLIALLKKRIATEIGEFITVSVGVSTNKILAKLASGLKKPNGVCVISDKNLEEIYKNAVLQDICGIGPRIEARLIRMGILTLLQLRKTSLSYLVAEFGNVEGNFLYNVGQGKDVRPVVAFTRAPDVKSVGRQYCLPHNEHNERVVMQNVYELYEEVALKLRRLNKKARSCGLSLYGSYTLYGHITQQEYVDSGYDLFQMGMKVVEREYSSFPPGYVRRIGVWVSYLEDKSHLSLPLFPEARRKEKIISIRDTINDTFGNHTIRNGFLYRAAKLTTVPNGFMSDRVERTKLAQSFAKS